MLNQCECGRIRLYSLYVGVIVEVDYYKATVLCGKFDRRIIPNVYIPMPSGIISESYFRLSQDEALIRIYDTMLVINIDMCFTQKVLTEILFDESV